MKFLVAVFQLAASAACVKCTLYQDSFSISNVLRRASHIFQPAGASLSESIASNQDTSIRFLRSFTPLTSGSLATNEYVLFAIFQPSSKCNQFSFSVSYETNVCILSTDATFEVYTTQPFGAVQTSYSDASCTTKIKEFPFEFQKTCQNDSMIYATPTFALPYTLSHVEIRYENCQSSTHNLFLGFDF
jgi:hypothetical protein